ncbi:MAG TPA: hypothetical protein VGI13_12755, partial [Candidatus Acidoferrum sp.]
PIPKSNEELQINWLYGAYEPKNFPLHPLTNHQRLQLFLRQSFLPRRAHMKTAFVSLSDQAQDHPSEWGDGFGGYAKRAAQILARCKQSAYSRNTQLNSSDFTELRRPSRPGHS